MTERRYRIDLDLGARITGIDEADVLDTWLRCAAAGWVADDFSGFLGPQQRLLDAVAADGEVVDRWLHASVGYALDGLEEHFLETTPPMLAPVIDKLPPEDRAFFDVPVDKGQFLGRVLGFANATWAELRSFDIPVDPFAVLDGYAHPARIYRAVAIVDTALRELDPAELDDRYAEEVEFDALPPGTTRDDYGRYQAILRDAALADDDFLETWLHRAAMGAVAGAFDPSRLPPPSRELELLEPALATLDVDDRIYFRRAFEGDAIWQAAGGASSRAAPGSRPCGPAASQGETETHRKTTTMTCCPNCDAEVIGGFCHECGQEQGPLLPSLFRWAQDVMNELFMADARVPRTVALLLGRPGRLTRDWAQGRRARYVAPIRLFLVSAVVLFFVWEAGSQRQVIAGHITAFLEGYYSADATTLPSDLEAQARRMADRVVAGLNLLLLVGSVPLLAVLNSLFRWTSGPMVLHFTFSLHVHAVGLTVISAWLLIGHAFPVAVEGDMLLVPLGLIAVYLTAALRTAYSVSWRAAIAQSLGLIIGYCFLATLLTVGYGLIPWALDGAPSGAAI